MDQAKSGLTPKAFINERGAEIPRELRPTPILWEPSKL